MRKTKDSVTPQWTILDKEMVIRVHAAFRDFAEKTIIEARKNLRERLKRPGSLLQKFDWLIPQILVVKVANRHHFAKGIEFGVPPFELPTPQKRYFFKEGEWKVRWVKKHPGIKATHFLGDAFRKCIPFLTEQIKKNLGGK